MWGVIGGAQTVGRFSQSGVKVDDETMLPLALIDYKRLGNLWEAFLNFTVASLQKLSKFWASYYYQFCIRTPTDVVQLGEVAGKSPRAAERHLFRGRRKTAEWEGSAG